MIKIKTKSAANEPEYNKERQELTIEPVFYRGERQSLVGVILVELNGGVVGRYALRIDSKTGGLSLVDRTKPVKAAIDSPLEAPKAEKKV